MNSNKPDIDDAETRKSDERRLHLTPEEARQAQIVLDTRKKRRIFFGGMIGALVAIIALALIIAKVYA